MASSTVPAAGAQLSVAVVADRECAWTSRSDATWAQVSPAAGQGEANVSVAVSANPTTSSRTAKVTVNDAVLQVSQAAAPTPLPPPPPPCSYRLDPASRSINDNGGNRTVRIDTGAGCPWSAVSGAPWIIVTSAASGVGPFTLNYTVGRNNSDDDRTGAIAIAGQTHLIHQDGD